MRILREESGRWKAFLSGPSFQITESFASESEAEQRVGGWFRRAFPATFVIRVAKRMRNRRGSQYREVRPENAHATGRYYTSARCRAECPRRR